MVAAMLDRWLSRLGFLDPLADFLQSWLGKQISAAGSAGDGAKQFLNGTWLGHPLHPLLTDVPVGAWTSSTLLDLVADDSQPGLEAAADLLVGIGCAAGATAALAGLADWQDSYGRERQVGLLHAGLNSGALTLFTIALGLRRAGARGPARPLALAGYALASAGSYLGGDLVFRMGVQVNRNAWAEGPEKWVEVAEASQVEADKVLGCQADGVKVILSRVEGQVCAVGATCPHAGGPLDQGKVGDGQVTCPWHGSRFDLATGAVVHGPATVSLPVYETRISEAGQVELRQTQE